MGCHRLLTAAQLVEDEALEVVGLSKVLEIVGLLNDSDPPLTRYQSFA